jgi:hypothetical protein
MYKGKERRRREMARIPAARNFGRLHSRLRTKLRYAPLRATPSVTAAEIPDLTPLTQQQKP